MSADGRERSATLLQVALGRAAGRRRGARSRPAGARLPRRRRPLRAQGRRQDRRRPDRLRRGVGRLGAAADPQRLRRGADPGLPRGVGAADPCRRRQQRQRQRRDRRPGLRRRAGDVRAGGDSARPRRRSVAVAETGTIGVPLPIEAVLPGIDEAAAVSPPRAAMAFSEAITTTDRWPKRCTLRAGGVTLSAQAKGAGMIEPNMATMLCFVQTDAVVEDPDAALRAATDASFNRITVDGQMSTNDCVLLQATGASGKPLPAGLLEAVLMQLAIEIVRDGEGASGSPGSRSARPPRPPRPSASPARSPTRRWSRRRCSAATPTGAGSPRPPARPWPARTWRRSAPTRSTPPSWARRPRRPRSACGSAAASTAPTSGSPTSATSTSGSTRSTRRERRTMTEQAPQSRQPAASRRCSRRCPTSASSTAARW